MTHIAVQEALDGVNVVWMDKVSDADYLSPLGEDSDAGGEHEGDHEGISRGGPAAAGR
jgi:hypothetical protein